MRKGVSIILTAWKTQDYIEECLNSISKQDFFNKTNYEILLGIDNCEKTLEKVNKIKNKYHNLKIFYFKENVGTYIISNTLGMMANYQYIFRFDTDDIMVSNAVSTLYSYAEKENADMLLAHCKNMYGMSKVDSTPMLAHGQIFIKNETFVKFGGFQPIRCGADTELYKRIVKFANVKIIPNVCTLRRIHNNNLTVNSETGMKSAYRKSVHAFIEYEMKIWIKSEKDAIIKCVTAPCYIIEGDTETLVESANKKAKSMYDRFMELPETIRNQYMPNNSDMYGTTAVTATGYLKKKAQACWTGYW